jgi:hypothetical protein
MMQIKNGSDRRFILRIVCIRHIFSAANISFEGKENCPCFIYFPSYRPRVNQDQFNTIRFDSALKTNKKKIVFFNVLLFDKHF